MGQEVGPKFGTALEERACPELFGGPLVGEFNSGQKFFALRLGENFLIFRQPEVPPVPRLREAVLGDAL
jgi:hypothetical protein